MDFAEFQPEAIAADLIARLKVGGFKFRNKKRGYSPNVYNRYTATHEGRGVKVEILSHVAETSKKIVAEFEVREATGRYNRHQPAGTNYGDFHCQILERPDPAFVNRVDPATFADRVLEAIPLAGAPSRVVKMAGRADLYPALRFETPSFEEDGQFTDRKTVQIRNVFSACRVKGVAVIKDDLKVTLEGSYNPKAECWFLVSGESASKASSASLDILVAYDGEDLVYYPVRHNKVTSDFTPANTFINYKAFTELDRELIERAVCFYVRDLC